MRASRIPAHAAPLALMIVLVLALAALTGCGKKAWPEPVKAEDRFDFAEPRAALAGGCLTIEADVAGAAGNIQEIILEIGPADCPDCPLRPDHVIRFTDPAGFMADRDTVLVRACNLPEDEPLRWRMRGVNALSRVSSVTTKTLTAQPSPATP